MNNSREMKCKHDWRGNSCPFCKTDNTKESKGYDEGKNQKPFKFSRGQIVDYHPIIGGPAEDSFEIIDFWRLGHGANVYKLVGKSGAVGEDALSLSQERKPSVCVRRA